jgi:glycerol uptake facilitator-like aquaporin
MRPWVILKPVDAICSKPQKYLVARSIIDNFTIEFVASLLIFMAAALFGMAEDDMRFAPSAAMGLVIVCLKDEDLFFPDAAPTVSLVLYFLGAYTPPELLSRLSGQLLAMTVVFAFLIEHPPHAHYAADLKTVFLFETLGTIMEHLTIAYLVLPMLSSTKRKRGTMGPENSAVAHAGVVVAVLHYFLQRGFKVEMSPVGTLLMMSMSALPMEHAITALAGQCIGVMLATLYLFSFAPRIRTR